MEGPPGAVPVCADVQKASSRWRDYGSLFDFCLLFLPACLLSFRVIFRKENTSRRRWDDDSPFSFLTPFHLFRLLARREHRISFPLICFICGEHSTPVHPAEGARGVAWKAQNVPAGMVGTHKHATQEKKTIEQETKKKKKKKKKRRAWRVKDT